MTRKQDRDREEWASVQAEAAALDEAFSSGAGPAPEGAFFEGGVFEGGESFEDNDGPPHDLETRAMAAAERALTAGHEALEAAQAAGAALAPRSRTREWVLRGLLVFNLLLMAGVLLVPDPVLENEGESVPVGAQPEPQPKVPAEPRPEPTRVPEIEDRYASALLRAAVGDLPGAVDDLERYLGTEPRMPAEMKRNVLSSLAHYSFQLGREDRAREYERRAAALTQDHFLPEDLIEMARRAEQEGDGVTMRRLYARFLLQQKQVPPSMHRYLAEAYLKLGDSYRVEADRGATQAREIGKAGLQPVTPEEEGPK